MKRYMSRQNVQSSEKFNYILFLRIYYASFKTPAKRTENEYLTNSFFPLNF